MDVNHVSVAGASGLYCHKPITIVTLKYLWVVVTNDGRVTIELSPLKLHLRGHSCHT